MSGGMLVTIIVINCFFSVALLVALYLMVNRLAGMEESLEKISILMTVMANKQGATQEDILSATAEDISESGKDKSIPSKKQKKN